MRRSPTLAALAVTVLCSGLAACGSSKEEPSAGASSAATPSASASASGGSVGSSSAGSAASSGSSSGAEAGPASSERLLVYSGRQEKLVGPILADFEKATGIDIDVRYGETSALALQLLEEGDRTEADVFFAQDGGALGALDARGRFDPIPQAVLDRVPAKYRAEDGTWVGTSGRSRVVVYDPKALTEDQVPDSVMDLTDPEWKGKIGIAPGNASFVAFVTAMRVLKGEDAARDWLKGIKANEPKIYANNIAILNAAEDGIVPLGLINHYYWYEQVAEEGADAVPARLKFLKAGDVGALVNVAGVGVLKGSEQATDAQRLVEYLVGDNAQKTFSLTLKEYPLVDGVELPPDLPSLASLEPPDIDLSDLESLGETNAMLEEVGLS